MRSISLLGPIMPFLLFSNGIEHEQSQRRREGLGSYIYKMKIWVERAVERRRRRRRRIEKESLYLKVWTSKKAKDGHRNASNRSNQIHTNSSRTCPIHIGFWSNWIGITRDYGWNSLLMLFSLTACTRTSCLRFLLSTAATMHHHHPLLILSSYGIICTWVKKFERVLERE